MSSLAAARADGFYYPPEYDGEKHGSLNKFRGQHALRERARKLDQGILVIRFEMPFNVWCEGCGHMIAKGVRFNAEKKQVGNYFSTKIWSFSMRSPCCQTRIEIHTDPKNAEYAVVAGARRKVETYDAEQAGTREVEDVIHSTSIVVDDPFTKLEKKELDRQAAVAQREQLTAMYADNETKHRDDYKLNKELRAKLRAVRKEDKALDVKREALRLDPSIKLLPESETDRVLASTVSFQSGRRKAGSSAAGELARAAAAARAASVDAGGLGGVFGNAGIVKAGKLDIHVGSQLPVGRGQQRSLGPSGGVAKAKQRLSVVSKAAALLKRQCGR